MFRNNYQGGAVVEIFSAQGKDPVAKWKLCGGPSAIHKEYNKEIKGFVYCLEGSSQTVKMQMPENGKMSLGLLQRFLVLQVNIPQSKDFSIELVITDTGHLKRRLYLSTVHKELSVTLWHARIPLAGLKRNIWSTLCIDLVSFTGELFKDTGFLRLDGITLFASCKLRRIFTMKTEPTGMSDDDMFLSGAGLMDLIPRSCQFPANINHVTQVFNMKNLRKADLIADYAPDQSVSVATTRLASNRKTRPQGVLQTASGSRTSGPPPQNGRKTSAAPDGIDSSVLCISNMGSPSSRVNQKGTTESQNITSQSEKLSHEDSSDCPQEGTSGILQPHPPKDRIFDKQGSKKLRVYSAGRQKPASPDTGPVAHRNRSKTKEKCTHSSSEREIRQQPLTLMERTEHRTAGEAHICCDWRESRTAGSSSSVSNLFWPGSSSDLQVWSSWESNEGAEPQLSLEEEVFTFSSQPHSPKRGQGQGDQEKTETGDHRVQNKSGRRCDAQPEDDFIGSESDEEKIYATFQHQRKTVDSSPATSISSDSILDVELDYEVHPESQNINQTSSEDSGHGSTDVLTLSTSTGRAETSEMVPRHCLSPSASLVLKCHPCGSQSSSVSFSRRLLHEVQLESRKHKEEDKKLPVDSSDCMSSLLGNLHLCQDDDEELRMLASLKREQEEDECRASGLSASQIHRCNVSISMSSDDTSTWTHVSMPDNQGHHYQKEMNPLLSSNPREWMDVLSPPIMPPSQHRRSGNTWDNREDLIGGEDEPVTEEDEYLNLLYDPCLNCYFDPKTGKYYELA
ncbi:protein CFAP20DC [Sphaeramia orbicularis]|uniref:protein CFAP20DC n=1 Tax=Sphaeramia orbicularis TaxID=375764 RepID=UPI00117BFC83|nr:uncharacterized protein C3orf67 homolog [Sphaeramia orbicularis]